MLLNKFKLRMFHSVSLQYNFRETLNNELQPNVQFVFTYRCQFVFFCTFASYFIRTTYVSRSFDCVKRNNAATLVTDHVFYVLLTTTSNSAAAHAQRF